MLIANSNKNAPSLITFTPKRDCIKARYITIRDDSMSGTVEIGDRALVEPTHGFIADGFYMFSFNGVVHTKRIQRIKNTLWVLCDNPLYDSWMIPVDQENKLYILGIIKEAYQLQTKKFW